jgi:hypothetical protein
MAADRPYDPMRDYSKNFDDRGHFKKGNQLAKGNVFNRRVAELNKVLQNALTDEKMIEACNAMIEKAIAGDVAAFKVITDRAMGKPKMSVDITSENGASIGLTLAQIQVAVYKAVKNDPKARIALAGAFKELALRQQTAEENGEVEEDNGQGE